ncbi:MAG: YchJ family metal-binding protein [Planctomycetota bacterium]
MTCTCGKPGDYASCCAPVIAGQTPAPSPEALMRARYSAYVHCDIDFLYESLAPSERAAFDRAGAEQWSKLASWQGLDVLRTEGGGAGDDAGVVEFVARYRVQEKDVAHHEVATFRREDGRWFFVDGTTPKQEPYRRATPKVGPNDACPCGSGKKFKKCCGKV